MAVFVYNALKKDGSVDKGELEASDRSDAVRRLDRKGLQPVSVKPKGDANAAAAPKSKKEKEKPAKAKTNGTEKPAKEGGAPEKKEKTELPAGGVKLKRAQIVLLTEELADLLGAGLQLEPALRIMEGRDELSALKTVTTILRQEIRDGSSFSNALRKSSPSFGDLYCNLAAAGEISGALPTILRRQCKYLMTLQELQSKVLFALIYPAFLVGAGVAVGVLFITFLIPQLTVLLKSMGKELPLAAKGMLWVGDAFKYYWWLIIFVVVFAVWLFQKITTSEKYRPSWDRIKLRLPLFGPVFEARFYVQFLETLGNLIGNGLPLLRGLELTRNATPNIFLKEKMAGVIASVGEGASLSRTMRKDGYFPPLLTDMITVGEQTGDLPLALERAATRFDKELQKKIDKISALIQPVVVVVMAGVVGSMAYMMITVILESITAVK